MNVKIEIEKLFHELIKNFNWTDEKLDELFANNKNLHVNLKTR